MRHLNNAEIIEFEQTCIQKLNSYLGRFITNGLSAPYFTYQFDEKQLGSIYSLVEPLEQLLSQTEKDAEPLDIIEPYLKLLCTEVVCLLSKKSQDQSELFPQKDLVFSSLQVAAYAGSDKSVVYATLDAHRDEYTFGVKFYADQCKILSCDEMMDDIEKALDADLERGPLDSLKRIEPFLPAFARQTPPQCDNKSPSKIKMRTRLTD